ncbi:MAG TPA: AI-2E family transporter [Candidatus Nanoarchaeia archaeon]|nr:AI-2E family transporter [Candidatus Nanoarchaeia archaeon]
MADGNFSKNFFLVLLIALIVTSILIISPFLSALISGAIISYIFYPVFRRLANKIRSKRLASGLLVLLLIILITVPMYFIAESLTKEGYTLFITVKQKLSDGSLIEKDCATEGYALCEFGNKFIAFLQDPQVKFYVQDAISKLSNFIITQASNLIITLPQVILYLIVMFFAIYYFFVDGEEFIKKTKGAIPLKSSHIDEIIKQFDNFTYATLYGNLVTAIVQGFVGGIIFFALGLSTPILAGLAMAFFAFLPVIGTPIIWVPAVITLFIAGETAKAIVLLLLGIFVISMVDNILKPEIIGKRTNVHPGVVLVGTLGGIVVIGPIGIIVGPLLLSLMISFIQVYYEEGM